MKLKEFVDATATKTGLSKRGADETIRAIFEVITEALVNGEEVSVPGFGKFSTIEKAARTARNPHDGTTIEVPAKKAPKFKYSANVKKAILGE